MIWQDMAITILNIMTGYALVPQVYHGFKTKTGNLTIQTAAITTTAVFSFAIIFSTMGLLFSTVMCTFNGIMWALLLIQKLMYR